MNCVCLWPCITLTLYWNTGSVFNPVILVFIANERVEHSLQYVTLHFTVYIQYANKQNYKTFESWIHPSLFSFRKIVVESVPGNTKKQSCGVSSASRILRLPLVHILTYEDTLSCVIAYIKCSTQKLCNILDRNVVVSVFPKHTADFKDPKVIRIQYWSYAVCWFIQYQC